MAHMSFISNGKKNGTVIFFYSKGTSHHSNGLITLLHPNIDLDQEPKLVLSEQRFLSVELKLSNEYYLILNSYAPNKKREKFAFFEKLLHCIEDTNNYNFTNTLVCGDFNTVLNNSTDIISGAPHDLEEVNIFNSLLKSCDLYDTWRW